MKLKTIYDFSRKPKNILRCQLQCLLRMKMHLLNLLAMFKLMLNLKEMKQ